MLCLRSADQETSYEDDYEDKLDEIMGYLTVMFTLGVLVLGLLAYWIHWKRKLASRLPPGPSFLTIIYRLFIQGQTISEFLSQCRTEYGDVICFLRYWSTPIVVVSGQQTLHHIFENRGFTFTGRPLFATRRKYTSGIFSAEGNVWKERIKVMKESFGTLLSNDIDRHFPGSFTEIFGEKSLKDFSQTISMKIIHRKCFGEDISDETCAELLRAINIITREELTFTSYMFPKITKYLMSIKPSYMAATRYLENHVVSMLSRNKSIKYEEAPCFVSHMINNAVFNDEMISSAALDLLILGTIATGTVLSSTINCLIRDSSLQRSIQRSLSNDAYDIPLHWRESKEGPPSTSNVLLAFVREILRLHPPFPLGLPRRVLYDTQVMGLTVPSSAIVLADLGGVLRDVTQWERPEEFDFNRFLFHDQPDTGNRSFQRMSFSTGRRTCIVEEKTNHFLVSLLCELLKRYSFTAVDKRNAGVSAIHHTQSLRFYAEPDDKVVNIIPLKMIRCVE